ncbi:MAG TPA: (2Fe-2S)-binding protein [Acidimicrobiaceae bacterium]|jgi:carbon-monoxide dehydrogenase small subunit|nr:(2Fe-2S)-binding protein [Acidimicrobiaceae bacterium]MDP7259027.1 (2Fe-2S)-binding protein [Acidimicrobiales bacterium]HCV35405.1 (2Fe-2S)-binding protein [Acidimicrobiaceae bacterium]HJO79075.1 (2Fe-2S)-binding protein [Acidimicrobiales bacterium]|tara:strand:+ start:8271 stop:8762 length:492 start_codon:yes stop_codon:yes gene_type:complete
MSADTYSLKVNGTDRQVTESLPGESLLRVLRERLGFHGSKNACEEGECGSCTVVVNGQTVCSCLVLAESVTGYEITTIEGVADDDGLSDVQQAFIDTGAVQCGFCTPGLVMSVGALLDSVPDPDELAVREAISGNLCRCTGYGRIIEAVSQTVDGRRDDGSRS